MRSVLSILILAQQHDSRSQLREGAQSESEHMGQLERESVVSVKSNSSSINEVPIT
jgi:hypothetical protein